MRYLNLAVLLTLVALMAMGLEVMHPAAGTSIVSGLGPYLLAAAIFGTFVVIASPAGFASFIRQYRTRMGAAARGFLAMFGFGLAILLIVTALLALAGRVSWGDGAIERQSDALWLTVASAVILACVVALAEEPLFRGFLVGYLRWSKSASVTIGAVVTSALVFAIAHNLQDPFAWFTADDFPLFIGLFLLGVLLAVTYLVTRSLWCPIGLHAALVAFDLAILKGEVIALDLSPWWLGRTDDVREAPLIWLTWAIAAFTLVVFRKRLLPHFAVEKPFVGALLNRYDPESSGKVPALSGSPSRLHKRAPSLEHSSQGV